MLGGLLIGKPLLNIRKYLINNNLCNLEARESNPCFLPACPATSADVLLERFQRRTRFHG